MTPHSADNVTWNLVLQAAHTTVAPALHATLYIFGSSLSQANPRDIDLLLIIDESTVSSKDAYLHAQPLSKAVERATLLPVDLTILTSDEHSRSEFSKLVGAIKIRSFGNGKE